MTHLESTTFGSTGRTVTRLGFGGAPAGLTNYLDQYSPDEDAQREQVILAIQHAVACGITYFDTAAAYGSGESEKIFGEALEGRVTRPFDVLHAGGPLTPSTSTGERTGVGETGDGSQPDSDGRLSDYRPTPPLSNSPPPGGREQESPPSNLLPSGEGGQNGIFLATKVSHAEPDVRGSVERSLRNLRVDRIDLVQVHGGTYTQGDEDTVMGAGGVLETLEKARDEGLIRHIGFTTEDQNAPVYTFIRSGRFEVMQIGYNLIFQHPFSPDRPFGAMVEAEAADMGIVTMRALTSGVFQKWMQTIRPDDDFNYSSALLQFVLSNPHVDVALVGMRTPEEVDRNIAVLEDTANRVDIDALHSKYV